MEWKAWCKRDKNRKEAELEKKELAAKKTSRVLYRECERLIQENRNSWHERQETEKAVRRRKGCKTERS